ncbi:ATP-binding protein [Streptomyces hypolithicus]
MTNEPGGLVRPSQPSVHTSNMSAALGQPDSTSREFAMRFSSTPRGARLARLLAGERLDSWGVSYGTDPHETVVLVVAELCANAVVHGHVPGRDFRLRLKALPGRCENGAGLTRATETRTTETRTTVIRVEVTDTRAERLPVPAPVALSPDADPTLDTSGRGLLLVTCLADRWGWYPRTEGPGKTVWAEIPAGRQTKELSPRL